eukprot:gene6662-3327_t
MAAVAIYSILPSDAARTDAKLPNPSMTHEALLLSSRLLAAAAFMDGSSHVGAHFGGMSCMAADLTYTDACDGRMCRTVVPVRNATESWSLALKTKFRAFFVHRLLASPASSAATAVASVL